jgi:serine/threonine protein kinase
MERNIPTPTPLNSSNKHSTITVPSASSAHSSPSSVLGKGGYGCVLKPAFSDDTNTGNVITFPNHVSKIFFKQNAKNKAIANMTSLKTINNTDEPLFTYNITPYKRTLTKGNVPIEFRSNCKIDANNNLSEVLYPVHMPNLGVSWFDFIISPVGSDLYTQIVSLPIKTILQGFKKLLKTLEVINKTSIHADVKPQNILIVPSTGNMTLIDFDLLLPKEKYGNLPTQWNSPLETTLWSIDNLFTKLVMVKPDDESNLDSMEKYTQQYNRLKASGLSDEQIRELETISKDAYMETNHYVTVRILNLFEIVKNSKSVPIYFKNSEEYLGKLSWFGEWLDTKAKEYKMGLKRKLALKLLSVPTFDSFCLGFSFMIFLDKYKPNYHTTEGILKNIYDEILLPLVNPNPITRMRSEQALQILNPKINSVMGGTRSRSKSKNNRRNVSRTSSLRR